jgi:hypothetical protein
MKLLVVLTQYKRNHLEKQLEHISRQTLKPDYLVVFQNENHIDITYLKNKYNFIHIKSDYNTKYFGRFASCFTFPVDLCVIMDDDIIPGINCLKTYTDECIRLNGIIGGNGRIAIENKHPNLKKIVDSGIVPQSVLVDFVGHLWCFKKEWLHYMFSIKPFTYDTGEDMHFCFSSKLLGNIPSYIGKRSKDDEKCDITDNKLADDQFASYKTTNRELRQNVEKYFIEKHNLKFIEKN